MMAERLQAITAAAGVPFIYKSSYDKANRSSVDSLPRPGPGGRAAHPAQGRRRSPGSPVLSDVHEVGGGGARRRQVLDVLQIPAFLCRQTDLLLACGRDRQAGEREEGPVPRPARHGQRRRQDRAPRATRTSCSPSAATSFGYNNLVVDFRGLAIMRELGYPVVFDATHSVQLPGGLGDRSGGERRYVQAPGARRGGVRRGRALHGDARGPGPHAARRPAALRRSQHAADRRSAPAARASSRAIRAGAGGGVSLMDARASAGARRARAAHRGRGGPRRSSPGSTSGS